MLHSTPQRSFLRLGIACASALTILVTTAHTPALSRSPRPVIADYLMWYDPSVFDGNQSWDVPLDGPYNSDDVSTIQRHVALAQQACLDGLAAHWYGPDEHRTTDNFDKLMDASIDTHLQHAIIIQSNIVPGATEEGIIRSINYVIEYWADHPNYLHIDGKPVIIFTDMPRPWGSDAAAQAGWQRVREATDPDHTTIWMAEGLSPTYNPLFDGLYVYRIDHRDYPKSWVKQPRWANGLRRVQKKAQTRLYFADSVAAGFDDTRSVNIGAFDLRAPAPTFARDRQNGQYYRDTFAPTAKTGGDFMFVKSFNEWVEGTQIEPGTTYGDLYIDLTCDLANAYRSR